MSSKDYGTTSSVIFLDVTSDFTLCVANMTGPLHDSKRRYMPKTVWET